MDWRDEFPNALVSSNPQMDIRNDLSTDEERAIFNRANFVIKHLFMFRDSLRKCEDLTRTFDLHDFLKSSSNESCLTRVPHAPRVLSVVRDWKVDVESYDAYLELYGQLGRYLVNGVDVRKINTRCHGDCYCPLQTGPVGDRGGISRIVPCVRHEYRDRQPFEIIDFMHVSRIVSRLKIFIHDFSIVIYDTHQMFYQTRSSKMKTMITVLIYEVSNVNVYSHLAGIGIF